MKDNKVDKWLKIILVSAVALIAVALSIYVIKPPRVKNTFEVCYDECLSLGNKPVDGKCEGNSHLGTKKGEPWCYLNGGYCLGLCK